MTYRLHMHRNNRHMTYKLACIRLVSVISIYGNRHISEKKLQNAANSSCVHVYICTVVHVHASFTVHSIRSEALRSESYVGEYNIYIKCGINICFSKY